MNLNRISYVLPKHFNSLFKAYQFDQLFLTIHFGLKFIIHDQFDHLLLPKHFGLKLIIQEVSVFDETETEYTATPKGVLTDVLCLTMSPLRLSQP